MEEFERAMKKVNVNLYEVFASVFYSLKEFYILDSGFSTYMTKDNHRLFKYKPISLRDRLKYGGDYMAIQGYKDLDIQFMGQGKEKPKTLRLFRVVYYPDFPFNIVFFQRLEKRSIDWSYRYGIFIASRDIEPLRRIRKIYRQYILKYRLVSEIYIATVITAGV